MFLMWCLEFDPELTASMFHFGSLSPEIHCSLYIILLCYQFYIIAMLSDVLLLSLLV